MLLLLPTLLYIDRAATIAGLVWVLVPQKSWRFWLMTAQCALHVL